MRSVVLAGGGSGGHVSPLLALADALRRRRPDLDITALGTAAGLEARLVPARGYRLETMPKVVFPRKISGDVLSLPGRLGAAVRDADRVVAGADVVVGFGGYVASPAYLAARRRGIPIVVHEQNARPGLANKLGARLTRHVAVTFESTPLPHAHVVGMPLRREIADLDRAALRAEARAAYGLDPEATTLLVTGGSLGAKRLNDAFQAAAGRIREAGIQVIHLTGRDKAFPAPGGDGPAYVVHEYADRMELAYAAADLVVARSGANTVCELTAVGLPAVYVPLPIGNGEQRVNATDVLNAGGGLLVEDGDLTAERIVSDVVPLLTNRPRLEAMAAASASCGRRDADEALADMVERAAGEKKSR